MAQSLTEPPQLLRFVSQPGPASVRPYMDAGISLNVVGMNSVAGPAGSWLVEVHDSFAGLEQLDQALRTLAPPTRDEGTASSDLVGGSRNMVALFRPGLSYRPEQAIQALRRARYCQVSIYQVHPGSEGEFAEVVKSRRVLFDSINLDRPDLAYYLISGARAGTYVFLAPLTSLKVLDDALAKAPAYAETAVAETPKVNGLTREYLLFRIEPDSSWVSQDFASADPDFWHVKAKTP